jgi:hypothetical protein
MAQAPNRKTSGGVEVNSENSWLRARELVDEIGQVPSFLSSALRMVRIDNERNYGVLGKGSKFIVERLVRTPSMKAPILYAGLTFHPDQLKIDSDLTADLLGEVYGGSELVAMIGLLYYFRRLQKSCSSPEWEVLNNSLQRDCEIGGHVGKAIPRIGVAIGLIAGIAPHLSSAMLLAQGRDRFMDYRSDLLKRKLPFDFERETAIWGCNHLQLLSMMLVSFGMSSQSAEAFCRGLYRPYEEISSLPLMAGAVTAAGFWIASLSMYGRFPEVTHTGDYYPLEKDTRDLLVKVKLLRDSGSQHNWLAKMSKDLPKEQEVHLKGNGREAPEGLREDVQEVLRNADLDVLPENES